MISDHFLGNRVSRRQALIFSTSASVAVMAAACGGGSGLDPLPSGQQAQPQPAPGQQGGAAPANSIGSGSVRIGLILPLSAAGGVGAAAAAIRNAAELAMSEFEKPEITLIVKDDRGDPAMAREMAQQALSEGAELILGPFTAAAVQQASQVTKAAGRPMIAFSSDTSVAQPGVYLLSFTPQTDVARVMSYAASKGKRSCAALLPEGSFGNVILAEFEQQISRLGMTQGPVRRYAPGRAGEAARALAGEMGTTDSLLATDLTDAMASTADAIAAAGINNVQMLGTGVWNDLSVLQKPALQKGWFAAPDAAGFNSFASRYRKRFNANPTRTATIGYDSVALAAALVLTQGSNRFTQATLTNPSGFAGQDGIFRFRADGTNERALAVLQVNNRSAQMVSAPPKGFGEQS
jgi:ABC-type branched-subunit amino acid transport system substrate-binding protein